MALFDRAIAALRGGPSARRGSPPTLAKPVSQLCSEAQFHEPVFSEWCRQLGVYPALHRKPWEFAFICQALELRGKLQPGMCGIGFGVGTEPLPALFAARGCTILATDQSEDAAAASGWKNPRQYAGSLDALQRPAICGEAQFRERVSFRAVDMRQIAGLGSFDFCWSACSLEHLGSAEAGMKFVCDSVDLLRPGGVAVHTTEMLCSDHPTFEVPSTVLYGKEAILELIARLRAKGCRVDVNLTRGKDILDGFIDVPPYRDEPHIKLFVAGFVTTSVGIIAVR